MAGLRIFTAHYHVCLWNNTEEEINVLVSEHMYAQSKISLCNAFLPVFTVQLCKMTKSTISLHYIKKDCIYLGLRILISIHCLHSKPEWTSIGTKSAFVQNT